MRTIATALALGIAALPPVNAAAQQAPIVVELFTSEACSSCPPADEFLTDLARERTDILPLAFHVTYWNDLGWRDPFSLDAATLRQQAYARSLPRTGWGGSQVYTPEMVVDGAHGFVGSSRGEGLQAISQAAQDHAARIPLTLTRTGSTLTIDIADGPPQALGETQGQLLLVGFDARHVTPIGRGENAGHTLVETNIVRSLTPIGSWAGTKLTLHQPIPAGEQFAVLLQAPDGRILGAARP